MSDRKMTEIKDRLAEALEAAGMRPFELCEKTGVPKSAISFYLAGKSKPKADRLYILARALDVSEAWLLGYDVPKARTPDQKKNDQLAQLVVKMRHDPEFFETVADLASLSENQYQSIKHLIATFKE